MLARRSWVCSKLETTARHGCDSVSNGNRKFSNFDYHVFAHWISTPALDLSLSASVWRRRWKTTRRRIKDVYMSERCSRTQVQRWQINGYTGWILKWYNGNLLLFRLLPTLTLNLRPYLSFSLVPAHPLEKKTFSFISFHFITFHCIAIWIYSAINLVILRYVLIN